MKHFIYTFLYVMFAFNQLQASIDRSEIKNLYPFIDLTTDANDLDFIKNQLIILRETSHLTENLFVLLENLEKNINTIPVQLWEKAVLDLQFINNLSIKKEIFKNKKDLYLNILIKKLLEKDFNFTSDELIKNKFQDESDYFNHLSALIKRGIAVSTDKFVVDNTGAFACSNNTTAIAANPTSGTILGVPANTVVMGATTQSVKVGINKTSPEITLDVNNTTFNTDIINATSTQGGKSSVIHLGTTSLANGRPQMLLDDGTLGRVQLINVAGSFFIASNSSTSSPLVDHLEIQNDGDIRGGSVIGSASAFEFLSTSSIYHFGYDGGAVQVGINKTTPATGAALDIKGTTSIHDGNLIVATTAGSQPTIFADTTNKRVAIGTVTFDTTNAVFQASKTIPGELVDFNIANPSTVDASGVRLLFVQSQSQALGRIIAQYVAAGVHANMTISAIRAGNYNDLIYLDGENTRVGINTTAPAAFTLEVAGNVGPDADNTRDLGSTALTWSELYITPSAGAGNTVVYDAVNKRIADSGASSRRYKENIKAIEDTSWIYKLEGIRFNYKNQKNINCYGWIAEDVELINPEILTYNSEGTVHGIRYQEVIPVIVEEMKKQKTTNDDQNLMITELSKEYLELKEEFNVLNEKYNNLKEELIKIKTLINLKANGEF